MSDFKEEKEKYASGNYICMYQEKELPSLGWCSCEPLWAENCRYRLIHKRDAEVLHAYIQDKNVTILMNSYKKDLPDVWNPMSFDFVDAYCEFNGYSLGTKNTKLDLNNTWCEATKENTEALREHFKDNEITWRNGLNPTLGQETNFRQITITSDYILIQAKHSKPMTGEQIHLIDGKFVRDSELPDGRIKVTESDIVCECGTVNHIHFEEGLIKCKSCGLEWYSQKYYEEHRDNLVDFKLSPFAPYGFQSPSFNSKVFFGDINSTDKTTYLFGLADNNPCHWDEEGCCYSSYNGTSMSEFDLKPIEVKKEWWEDESNFPVILFKGDCETVRAYHISQYKLLISQGFVLAENEEIDALKVKE